MKIYTSYFAKLNKIDSNIKPVAICAMIPKNIKIPNIKKLAPTWDILKEYKTTNNKDKYTLRYKSEVLQHISCQKLLNKLESYSEGKDIVLICYEKPTDFCHRHIVAEWINENSEYQVEELKV